MIIPKFVWLDPWYHLESPNEDLATELIREVGPGHQLYEHTAVAVGRKDGSDDVLFYILEINQLAVVHLTWDRKREEDPSWPTTHFYSNWEEWIEKRMNPDNEESNYDV